MQWEIVRCCRYVTAGACLESVGGIIQVSLQWFLFTVILVLYMIYYPQHLKYADVDVDDRTTGIRQHLKATNVKSDSWRLSITLSWVVFIHIVLVTFVTFSLLLTRPPLPEHGLPRQLKMWATFLGVTSAALAALQYGPQIVHTYRMKLVGALSIPMMLIQTPGSIFMVTSIALRPGTNWTSWITYAVAGMMQGMLLVMCIVWKIEQGKRGVDDFGNSLVDVTTSGSPSTDEVSEPSEDTPLIQPDGTAAAKKRPGRGWTRRFGGQ